MHPSSLRINLETVFNERDEGFERDHELIDKINSPRSMLALKRTGIDLKDLQQSKLKATYEQFKSKDAQTARNSQLADMKSMFFQKRKQNWVQAALIERENIIKQEKRLSMREEAYPPIKDVFTLTGLENKSRVSQDGEYLTSGHQSSRFLQNTPFIKIKPNAMKNCQSDKAFVKLQLRLSKEARDASGQEKLEKVYENFYNYQTYKNEERAQLKGRIHDETTKNQRQKSLRQKEQVDEDKKHFQQEFLMELNNRMKLFHERMNEERYRGQRIQENNERLQSVIRNHEQIMRDQFQQRYEELMLKSERSRRMFEEVNNTKRQTIRTRSQVTEQLLKSASTNRKRYEESSNSYRESLKIKIDHKLDQAEQRKQYILSANDTKTIEKKIKYAEVYDAYEKGMNEIKEIFKQRLIEKDIFAKAYELKKEAQQKENEEKHKLKEWDAYMNTNRVKKKKSYEQQELIKKLKFYEVKVNKFKQENEMIVRRAHFNIFVQQLRKQLLSKVDTELGLKKKFELDQLEIIDKDFKKHFIDENDKRIDEDELEKRYIQVFNLMSKHYSTLYQ